MQPGIDAVDGNLADGLVLRHNLAVEGRDIGDVSIQVYKVDVGILVDGDEALGLRIPGDVGDVGIAESADLVVGRDALVVLVILVESVGGQYEEIVVGSADVLYLVIGEVVVPGADLGESE